jgi:hypothetical protein
MVMVMQIILQPVLFEPDKDILSLLEKALLKEFNASSIVVAPPVKQFPDNNNCFYLITKEINGNQVTSYNGFQITTRNYIPKKQEEEQQQQKYLLYAILMHILVI